MKNKLAILATTLAAGALIVGATACDPAETTEAMTIDDAWSRQPADNQAVTAVYGVITNPNDTDITLISAETDVSGIVELHETITGDDGAMSMVEQPDGFVIEAGGSFALEPGGAHIMLLDIDAATYPDTIEMTLNFDGADPLTFTAEVRDVTASDMGDGAMGGMNGDHMGQMGDMREEHMDEMDDMRDEMDDMRDEMDDMRDEMSPDTTDGM